jgi:tetratricopeptide (TPR) repeat protein
MLRHFLAVFLTVTAVALSCRCADAGLFVPGEPADLIPNDGKMDALSFDRFRGKMTELTGAPGALDPRLPASELGKRLAQKMKELEQRKKRLTADEMTLLGALYYRLFRFDSALEILRDAARMGRNNFQAISDLAILFLAQGQYQDALQYLGDAKLLRPKKLPDVSAEQLAWVFKVDDVVRRLVRGRLGERSKKIPPSEVTPDDLFGVEFVGDGGKYQAGVIASAQKAKLPEDAIAIVQQMLLWTPADARLYWLLGELYNASGQLDKALTIMNECKDARRFQPDTLREHSQIIQDEINRRQEEQAANQRASAEKQEADRRQHRHIVIGVSVVGAVIVLSLLYWQVGLIVRKFARKEVDR